MPVAGAHTLAVITEAHLGLSETDGIFSGRDTIVLLELNLVDTLPLTYQYRFQVIR